jgi:hypothetical protein
MSEKFDPAALLIAVFAVGVNPLLSSGAWTVLNTVVSVVTLLIVGPYALSRSTRLRLRQDGPRVPVAATIGFVVAVGLAWPTRSMLDEGQWRAFPSVESEADLLGTIVALTVGLVVGVTVWLVLRFGQLPAEPNTPTVK